MAASCACCSRGKIHKKQHDTWCWNCRIALKIWHMFEDVKVMYFRLSDFENRFLVYCSWKNISSDGGGDRSFYRHVMDPLTWYPNQCVIINDIPGSVSHWMRDNLPFFSKFSLICILCTANINQRILTKAVTGDSKETMGRLQNVFSKVSTNAWLNHVI